jgi:hypothetical protein
MKQLRVLGGWVEQHSKTANGNRVAGLRYIAIFVCDLVALAVDALSGVDEY